MLIKQLMALNEGQVKNQMSDIVEQAIIEVDVSGLSYTAAIAKIAAYVIKHDNSELFGGNAREAADFVKGMYSAQEHSTIKEEEDSEFPKKIAKAGDFIVELDEDEQVRVLGGSGEVKLQMPLMIWKQLTRQ